jgi:hypothetical protein
LKPIILIFHAVAEQTSTQLQWLRIYHPSTLLFSTISQNSKEIVL